MCQYIDKVNKVAIILEYNKRRIKFDLKWYKKNFDSISFILKT
jgi:hypothetical protein